MYFFNLTKCIYLLCIFRQNSGYNKSQITRTVKTSISSYCIFSLCTSKGVNCEATQKYDNPIFIDLERPSNLN